MSSGDTTGVLHTDMAETIPAHLTGLVVPSMEVSQEAQAEHEAHSAAAARRRCVGDEEFPFACGTLNGIKCCSKCGATKTPQWREGPLGPKTLCNACGVKRTRKLRAEQEGGKRRKLSASPGKSARAAAASYAPEPAARMESYGSLEFDCYDALYQHYHYQNQHAPGSRRPQRRAAEEAAVRTARYAATGEWGSQAPLPPHWAAAVAAAQADANNNINNNNGEATPTASGSGDSLPSSDCPEEVSWAPAVGGAGIWAPPPPPLDLDSCAAVNLLTIGLRGPSCSQHTSRPRAHVCLPPAPALTASPVASVGQSAAEAEQANHDVLLAMAAQCPEGDAALGAPHAVAPVDLPTLANLLPPNKVAELIRLNQELEGAVHEAAASNAAVAAVAQVLAAKQAAALRAREAAISATKRLRRFMTELDTQFGIRSKCGVMRPQQQQAAAGAKQPLLP